VKYLALSLIVLSVALTSAQTIQPATLVLRNGKIVTVDAATPEAQAIAVRGDRQISHVDRDRARQVELMLDAILRLRDIAEHPTGKALIILQPDAAVA